MRNVQITFKYQNDIDRDLHAKIEKARKWLCEVLESWEFSDKGKKFGTDAPDYLRLVDGFEVRIKVQDLSNLKRPFKYEDRTVFVDPKNVHKDIEDIAGYLAHEIGHEWFDHGADFSSFMWWLQDEIPHMTPNPTFLEKLAVWMEWFYVKMGHFSAALFGFPLLPFAFLLKYEFGVKGLWLLNDTVDGDFGAEWWLKETGLKNKFIRAIRWWLRNSVWNLKLLTAPKWTGEYDVVQVIKNDVSNPLHWITQYERGTNFVYYEVEGMLYFRFSHSNKLFNVHFGMTGERYSFKLRRTRTL